jgi:hypothetical protein
MLAQTTWILKALQIKNVGENGKVTSLKNKGLEVIL